MLREERENKMSKILLYTYEEVEEVLQRMARYMHNKQPNWFHATINDMKVSGFSFVKINWNSMEGSYFGKRFKFYVRENLVTDQLEFKCVW